MEKTPVVTLVVPIRNSAHCLDAFFAGLAAETFQDFAIDFSLGTSTDGTADKLSELKQRYPNIRFSVQDVGLLSVGASKNYWLDGQRIASKYVAFIDVDDYLYPSYLEKLVQKAESSQADLVQCGFERVESESGKRISVDQVSNPELIRDPFTFPGIVFTHTATWNKLFRTQLIDENVRFFDGYKFEDLHFVMSYLAKCNSIVSINEPLYRYFVSKKSLSSIPDKETLWANADEVQRAALSLKANYLKINPKAYETGFLDALIFLRYGIGFTTRMCLSKHEKKRKIIKATKSFLDEQFPRWGSNFFFEKKNLKTIGKKSLFIRWCLHLYRHNNFGLFVFAYRVFTAVFHKDIKP
jgi:Glycosyltransferases, probably involved in cell wall biogenesis